jgi:hypothetical protein
MKETAPGNFSSNLLKNSNDPSLLINYIYEIMTEQEKIKFKSLNIIKSGVLSKPNKNCNKKNYSISFPLTSISLNLDRSFSNSSFPKLSLEKKEIVFCEVKEIEVQFLATKSREKSISSSSSLLEPKLKLNNYNLQIKSKRLLNKATKV